MTPTIHLTMNTAQDLEINSVIAPFEPVDQGHEVRFPDHEDAPGCCLINTIIVDDRHIDGLATVRYGQEICLQFFSTMPTVEVLMSIICALQHVYTNEGI